jgi:hypothetical protein
MTSMNVLLKTITAATKPGATDDLRTAGADACRALLAVLATPEGQPLAATDTTTAEQVQASPATPVEPTAIPVAAPMPSPPPHNPVAAAANIVAALRGVPPEQLFDLAIHHLRAALPADAAASASNAPPIRFHLIQLPRLP